MGKLKTTDKQRKQINSMRNNLLSVIEAQEYFSPLSFKEVDDLCRALVRKGYTDSDFTAGDYLELYHDLRSEDYNWKYVVDNNY